MTNETKELERVLGVSRKEREEDREALELVDRLERMDKERAADRVEELLRGWEDPLTGLPPAGMEGPRFRTRREREFMDWVKSPAGARTRAIRYPHLSEER